MNQSKIAEEIMSSYEIFWDSILLENKEIVVLQWLQFFFSTEIIEMPVIEQFSSPLATGDMYYTSLSIQSVIL